MKQLLKLLKLNLLMIKILHRDFRIHDNKGLIALSKEEKEIYLIFILTNEQIKNNKFFNLKLFQAMIFCLKQLNKIIHINVLKAENKLNAIRNLLNQGIIWMGYTLLDTNYVDKWTN